MRVSLTIFTIISLVLIHVINTEIPQDLYKKYQHSYKQWQRIKKQWNNSYQYSFGTDSWTGHRTTTTMFIQNGEVVGREYRHIYYDKQRDHWIENKDQLYSHRISFGTTQPTTFDNVYSTCLESLNVSTDNGRMKHLLVFDVDTKNHDLLKSCGNIPDGCADDCFFGVRIDDLKPYHQQQQQPTSRTVTMVPVTKKVIENIKPETTTSHGNIIISSNFLFFINIFIVKAIICAYSY